MKSVDIIALIHFIAYKTTTMRRSLLKILTKIQALISQNMKRMKDPLESKKLNKLET
jgi:hypothetical protein